MSTLNATAESTVTEGLPTSTYALLERAAAHFGDAPALTFIPDAADVRRVRSWSFRELLANITQAANLFHAVGVVTGDVVAYALPNGPETHFALWGAEAAGIALAINPALGAEQVAELLRAAGVRVLVTTTPRSDTDLLSALLPHLGTCPSLTHVFTIGEGALPVVPGRSVLDFVTSMACEPADRLASGRRIDAAESSSWFCTGGTTGAPKIARRTHSSEVADAAMTVDALRGRAGPGRTFFCGLPLFHVNAAMVTGLVPWLAGSHVVLGPANGYRDKALIANFWKMVEAHRINVFSGAPTIFGALLQVPTDGHDLGSLDFAVCGAAPMPVELARRFEQATGIRILEAYGLTESACISTLNPKSEARHGLVAELQLRQRSPALRAALGSYAFAAEITEG